MEWLASNATDFLSAQAVPDDDQEVVSDVVCGAGLLGVVAVALPLQHAWNFRVFPDSLFWHVLPLLLVIPPAVFLGVLFAPGGLLSEAPSGWPRALRLALGSLVGYSAPVLLLSLSAALGGLR